MKQPLTLALLFLLAFFAGCSSVPKLLEKGRIDRAYAKAAKPCTRARARNRPVKEKKLILFRDAYAAVQSRDLSRVASLNSNDEASTWPARYRLYSNLLEKSEDLANVLPGAKEFEWQPELLPETLASRQEAARKESGKYYLLEASKHIPAARKGNKDAARDAFYDIEAALEYLPEQARYLTKLRDTLKETGTLRILLFAPLEDDWNRHLSGAIHRLRNKERAWTQVVTYRRFEQRIDLEAEVYYDTYSSSGPQYSSSSCTYSKEVLDWIEKKKEKVKINDTTWVEQVIEIKHFKTIYAEVTTHEESLSVHAYGRLAVFLPGEEDPLWTDKIYGSDSWSTTYTTCSGDSRALPGCSCSGPPVFVPGEGELVGNAISSMPGQGRKLLFRRYAPFSKQ